MNVSDLLHQMGGVGPVAREPGGRRERTDLGGDGNPLNDIVGMLGKLKR